MSKDNRNYLDSTIPIFFDENNDIYRVRCDALICPTYNSLGTKDFNIAKQRAIRYLDKQDIDFNKWYGRYNENK